MARIYHKNRPTRELILRTGMRLFLEKGYTKTHCSSITKELGISPGNLTFYFSTKEHLLAELVEYLCRYQWLTMEAANEDGKSPLYSYCMELASMAALCRKDAIARDFYLSSYTHPISLEMIRKNDTIKTKQVFQEFCPDFTDENFRNLENIVSGIEYATLATDNPDDASFENMLEYTLDCILFMYRVPEEIRQMKIKKVLRSNYQQVAQQMLKDFPAYVEANTEQALEAAKQYLESHSAAAMVASTPFEQEVCR